MDTLPRQFDKLLEKIAKENFPGVETLETRGMDDLDFHDVSVWSIKNALKDAFFNGMIVGNSIQTESLQSYLWTMNQGHRFKVCRFNDNQGWTILDSFMTYDEADNVYDYWDEKYPNAFIDIVEFEEVPV